MSEIALERAAATLPTKTFSRQSLKWALSAGLAGLLALAAARYAHDWWSVGRFLETTDDAYVGGNVTPISPHVAGFVAQILVADNDHVRAGQLLIRLDDRDFQAAVDRATAILAQRQATLASLEARELLQQSTIRQAEADVDAKKAQAAFTSEDDARYRQLAQSSAGSQQNAQKALASNAVAQSAVASSRAALEAARQQLAVLDAQIAEARAVVAEAEADFRTTKLNLELHGNPFADRRLHRQSRGPDRGLCLGGRLSRHRHPGERSLGGRQFQGGSAPAHGAGPGRDGRCRQLAGPCLSRPRAEPLAGHRRDLQRDLRPRTRPATSPRSCSAFRCASSSTATTRCFTRCGRASRRP